MTGIKPSCVICAWRADCKKQFNMADPSRCADYSLDVSIKDLPGRKGVKVLVEGPPGSGKTTLVERVMTRLKGRRAGGFITREIREGGRRTGFRIITLDKQEGVLAHEGLAGGLKVGGYTVNLEDLEKVAVAALERALVEDDLVVVDEIGAMELMSHRFGEMVEMAMEGEKQLLATVAAEGPPFIDEVKRRSGVHLLRLTRENRDAMVDEVVRHIEGAVP